MDPEHETIRRILGGDSRQFVVLVDRYKDRAFALASRLLGSREEAEEAVQDAFVKAYHRLADFRGDSRFGTWYYRILYNTCMTSVSRRPSDPLPLDDLASGEGEIAIESDEPDRLELMASKERLEILSEELQKLPQKFKAVLMLFYIQEQRYEEIAAVLGIPLNTVKSHLFRARGLLRKRIQERYNEEMRAA
jgi:RNA polymerase sigma-70 factor (ECF subfamily)